MQRVLCEPTGCLLRQYALQGFLGDGGDERAGHIRRQIGACTRLIIRAHS